MNENPRLSPAELVDSIKGQAVPSLVTVYLALILLCFIIAPVLYIESLGAPFIGAFVEHSLMINTSQPTIAGSWELNRQLEPRFGDQLVALDEHTVESIFHFREILNRYKTGAAVQITLRTPEGDLSRYAIHLQSLPFPDQVRYFIIPYLTGLVYFISGLYVFNIRRREPVGLSFTLFTASVAMVIGGIFDLYTHNFLTLIWTCSLAIAGGALFSLSLIFPENVRLVVDRPFLRWLPYIPSGLLILIGIPTIYNLAQPEAYVLAWRLSFIYLGAAALFFIVMIGARWLRAASPVVREQARLIFWGALIAFIPMTIYFVLTSINVSLSFSAWLVLPLVIFPVVTGYAIIRYRLLSTDYLLSRGALYLILTALAVLGYALVVSGLSQIFGDMISPTNPLLIGLFIFVLALSLNPARLYLQRVIDNAFFRGQVVYRERQQAFGRELTQEMEIQGIAVLLRAYVENALQPSQIHVFIYDPLSGYYSAMPDDGDVPSSDVRFPVGSPLVKTLSRRNDSLFLTTLEDLPQALQPERARLMILGVQLFVPLPGRQQLIGWLALDTRRSGDPFVSRDLDFLEALGSQAALAIERAQVVEDLERRVREMNVLTRVAQGVNFTISFDDILELIFAQTSQVLPTRDFRLTLYDTDVQALQHVFYLNNDERLLEKENKYLPVSYGLENEVISNQRALVTDDYEHACRSRGLLPDAQGIYAWMGVPLNAGAQTIGVVSMGSRDSGVLYTDEQRDLFQAIADQAAGAIVKSRLLQESVRRARQLATLNEIGVGLTSNLALRPLLRQILESATEILACEAGSLFLVDEETRELVFEVVLGPVADNLTGRRLPAGTGVVGEAVDTGQPLIANDAKRRKEWYEQSDIQTGFDTQDLLVVPMRLQDQVIGVIEVINKRNGAPFTSSDQELLMIFTNQATIAIENARLFTMTDRALAERVEELSVMQRIDRELNASLEFDRAMRITLDWALRQSKADAGLVGTVEADGVHVMTAQGFGAELAVFQPQESNGKIAMLPANMPGLVAAIDSGQPQSLLADDIAGEEHFGILPDLQAQLVIPIRRETSTIGVLMLESRSPDIYPAEVVEFLSRLTDHAAIAIANAQLYEEVNEANLAKSRFVSFVAHELKNPMASIKGYTELVAKGVAGPVNDMQTSFLDTVRSNVDRMNTIVSDLNDLTKIQVGNMRLEYHSIHIQETLDEIMRSFNRQIEEKEQRVAVDFPDDLPLVWADPSRLAQILTNLLSNAIKYTSNGGEVWISAERIIGGAPGDDSGAAFVHLSIKDSGIGISDEDQENIFEQYFRTEAAKEMASGTGLGLNITRSLVEMQGGRIWFESTAGEGTTFHFTIPVSESN